MDNFKIAIVGCGPRGLACLEALIGELIISNLVSRTSVLVFEPAAYAGAGAIWNPEQRQENWINIDNYALQSLKERKEIKSNDFVLPKFPSFTVWIEKHNTYSSKKNKKLIFYPRYIMGKYLNERYNSIFQQNPHSVFFKLIQKKIVNIGVDSKSLILSDNLKNNYKINECLIAIGHQEVTLDKQLKSWENFSKNSDAFLFLHPYKEDITSKIKSPSTIAIRGFGLAMIDVMRMLVAAEKGEFIVQENSIFLKFKRQRNTINKIVPFSLNGLPPVPKPNTLEVDDYFKPHAQDIKTFETTLKDIINSNKIIENTQFLIETFSELVVTILTKNPEKFSTAKLRNDEIKSLSKNWLNDMSIKHDTILDTELNTLEYLKATAQMAYGQITFSLDYAIGQIWRHIQPTLYSVFAFSKLEDSVIEAVIKLDANTKRYSYGPPVKSILQLIALANAKILDLSFLNNPKIKTKDSVWLLSENDNTTECDIMINSVLPPPVLKDLDSKIINNLDNNNFVKPVTSKLGIETNEDGTIIAQRSDFSKNIAIIGRICKGSIVGSDAILECFNEYPKLWAKAVVTRNF